MSFPPVIRALRRNATTTGLAATSIGFALAANLVLVSLLWSQFSNPPYPNIGRLVEVWAVGPSGPLRSWNYPLPIEAARRLTSEARTFSEIALSQGHQVPLELAGESRQGWIQEVTPNYHRVLGARPFLGRFFTADDSLPGAPGVALLSFESWTARFGADSTVVGRTIRIRGVPHVIVGVIPAGISAFDMPVHVPLRYDPASRDAREQHVSVTALLRQGANIEAARSEIQTIGARLRQDALLVEDRRLDAGSPAYFARRLAGGPWRMAIPFLPTIALLLAASLNVAGLLLARGLARQREYGIRLALGASRWDVGRAALSEAALLVVLGLMVAGCLTVWGFATILRRLPHSTDLGIAALAAVLAIGTALLAGALPALRAMRLDVQRVLRNEGSAATHGAHFRRVQGALVVGQSVMAVTFTTLLVAFAISFARNVRQGLGFDPAQVLTFTLRNPHDDAGQWRTYRTNATEALGSTTGVVAVSFYSSRVVMPANAIRAEGARSVPQSATHGTAPRLSMVDAGYFDVLTIPVIRGRAPLPDEVSAGLPVAVINEQAAALWFPGVDPIGKRILVDSLAGDATTPTWLSVIGVVGSIRDEPLFQRTPPPAVYTTAALWTPGAFTAVARTSLPPDAVVPVLRRSAGTLVGGEAPPRIERLDDRLRREDRLSRDQAAASGAATVFTVCLALLGLYGMVRMATEQRSRELAVRAALGASPVMLVRLVMKDAAGLVIAGAAIGGGVALVVFGVTALGRNHGIAGEVAMTVSAAVAFGVAALAASFPQAWRVARSSPSVALRET